MYNPAIVHYFIENKCEILSLINSGTLTSIHKELSKSYFTATSSATSMTESDLKTVREYRYKNIGSLIINFNETGEARCDAALLFEYFLTFIEQMEPPALIAKFRRKEESVDEASRYKYKIGLLEVINRDVERLIRKYGSLTNVSILIPLVLYEDDMRKMTQFELLISAV